MSISIKTIKYLLASCLLLLCNQGFAQEDSDKAAESVLERPLIERYILDELKALRQDQQNLRVDVSEKVTTARLDASDRAVRYTTDTVNNIFFIITGAASILVLVGWRSFREIKENMETAIEAKVAHVTQEYESRLNELELKLKRRTEQIIANQEQISQTNQIHSLWMRAGLETTAQERIKIYDEILTIKPGDIEALTYKADAVLEIGEAGWALNLANQAVELDEDYAFAYWQRACAKAELDQPHAAIQDIRMAIEKSPTLQAGIQEEPAFHKLWNNAEFTILVTNGETDAARYQDPTPNEEQGQETT